MAGLLAAIYRGNCSGHGVCIPANIHANVSCGTPCPAAPRKPLAAMNASCLWPPLALAPLSPVTPTVTIEKIAPILDGDQLTLHQSACTNIIMVGPCGQTPPVPVPCSCSILTVEDNNGVGHPRTAKAICATVWVMKRRLCRISDPLGPPCLSTIASGAATVYVGP